MDFAFLLLPKDRKIDIADFGLAQYWIQGTPKGCQSRACLESASAFESAFRLASLDNHFYVEVKETIKFRRILMKEIQYDVRKH